VPRFVEEERQRHAHVQQPRQEAVHRRSAIVATGTATGTTTDIAVGARAAKGGVWSGDNLVGCSRKRGTVGAGLQPRHPGGAAAASAALENIVVGCGCITVGNITVGEIAVEEAVLVRECRELLDKRKQQPNARVAVAHRTDR